MTSSASSSASPSAATPSRGSRLPLLIVVALVALWSARVALVWNRLPAQMASHFDTAGVPNGWMSKPGFFLFDVILTVALAALFLTAPRWLRHLPPNMVNLPAADYWMAPERIEASLPRIGAWMAWLSVGVTVFILGISDRAMQANLEGGRLGGSVVGVGVAAFLLGIAIWSLLFYRAFRRPRAA